VTAPAWVAWVVVWRSRPGVGLGCSVVPLLLVGARLAPDWVGQAPASPRQRANFIKRHP
jgi:hypothetical protein